MRRALGLTLVTAAVLAGCGGARASDAQLAQQDATNFLDRFADRSGRVVRHDQGGDTVSEGQAYGMLLAVAAGDERRFRTIWRWTRVHLQRNDSLLSWKWSDGRVRDRQPAADADMDAAHALASAARRFHHRPFAREAARIGRAVRNEEIVRTTNGPVLAAGPWARSGGTINPSYTAPAAFSALAAISDRASWRRLAAGSRHMIDRVSGPRSLPPDWARASGAAVTATSAPGRPPPPVYSWDAVRVPIRFAAACKRSGRRRAAALWPLLRSDPGALPRGLSGKPKAGAGQASAGLAASAAAAVAAGRRGEARDLLARAAGIERGHPTYYGSALVALTRAMVMTHSLGRC